MSILLGSIAAYMATRRKGAPAGAPEESYLAGTDFLCGAPTVGGGVVPVAAESTAITSSAMGNFFWRSVGAGLVVAGILTVLEYGYAKCRGWPHHLDSNAKGWYA